MNEFLAVWIRLRSQTEVACVHIAVGERAKGICYGDRTAKTHCVTAWGHAIDGAANHPAQLVILVSDRTCWEATGDGPSCPAPRAGVGVIAL